MLIVFVGEGNEPAWSLSGWTLNVKQVGDTTYGWYLTDPDGNDHKCSYDRNGYYLQYNIESLEHLVKSVNASSSAKQDVQRYLLSKPDGIKKISL